MRTYRVHPLVSGGSYPPGTAVCHTMLVQAEDKRSAELAAAKKHSQSNPFAAVSEWYAVEERG